MQYFHTTGFRRHSMLLGMLIAGFTYQSRVFADTPAARMPVVDLRQVAGSLFAGHDTISAADHIYHDSISTGSGKPIFAIYELGGAYTRLTGAMGLSDDDQNADMQGLPFAIAVDGKTVLEGSLSYQDKPIPVDLDINGAQSLRITIIAGVRFLEPMLTKALPVSPTTPVLLSPESGILVDKRLIVTWKPVQRAVSYGVQILPIKLAGQAPLKPVLHSYNTDTSPKVAIDVSAYADGQYRINVVAFSSHGPLGEFCQGRTVTVAHN